MTKPADKKAESSQRRVDPSEAAGAGLERVALVQKLFIKHSSVIKGFIAAILPDFGLVDDVLHETFLVVTEKADAFEPESNFVAWSFAIAKRKVLEASRSGRCRLHLLAPEVMEAVCAEAPYEDFEQLTEDRGKALAECIEKLSPRAKSVIRLRYREAYRPAEIARQLSLAAETVYVTLSRARQTLRKCVDRKLAATKRG